MNEQYKFFCLGRQGNFKHGMEYIKSPTNQIIIES